MTSKPPKLKKSLRIHVIALPVGYEIVANVAVLHFYKNIAAVTTKTEVITVLTDLVNQYLR